MLVWGGLLLITLSPFSRIKDILIAFLLVALLISVYSESSIDPDGLLYLCLLEGGLLLISVILNRLKIVHLQYKMKKKTLAFHENIVNKG